jgi:hypothetical protein
MKKVVIIIFALFLMLVSVQDFLCRHYQSGRGTSHRFSFRIFLLSWRAVCLDGRCALSQMTAYLNQDGVDLTEIQANRAIQLMHL